jgi:MOSC domain-containing protein YiiM
VKTIEIVSVNVATPSVLASIDGEVIVSAIGKRPVTASKLWLSPLNLEGDAQADLRVHGGHDKAVYAYPTEHLRPWSEELGLELGPGAFGENLSIAGALEDEVFIGDTWRWGDALLQVAQPRSPCYKLAVHLQRPQIIKRMLAGERTGWYLRVLRPGEVPVAGPIGVVSRDPRRISVAAVHRGTIGRARVGRPRAR